MLFFEKFIRLATMFDLVWAGPAKYWQIVTFLPQPDIIIINIIIITGIIIIIVIVIRDVKLNFFSQSKLECLKSNINRSSKRSLLYI